MLPEIFVSSAAYRDGDMIPREFTCDGLDRSPPFVVSQLPEEASCWAAVLDDPDAPKGTWTHWTFWDMPRNATSVPAGANIPALGGIEGTSSAKQLGYHGPCPPSGVHRYILRVFAMAQPLGLPSGAPVDQVWKAIRSKAIAEGQLIGRYTR